MCDIDLKSRSGKVFYCSIVVYYLVDIILSKMYSCPFLVGLVRTKFGLDIVSIGGIISILHWVFIIAAIPAFILAFRNSGWMKKVISIYMITAVFFYSVLFYGDIKGGGVLELDYIGYFLLTTAMLVVGILLFALVLRLKSKQFQI